MNTFGHLFRITTFGESHGKAIGVTIDGCPSLINFDLEFIQSELDRRKPGQSKITTQRKESDTVQVLSGVFEGKTTGTPIALLIPNEDQKSKDYDHNKNIFRPSHADFVYQQKYGIRDHRGGGRSSARETAARVAAGAVAKLLLRAMGIEVVAYVKTVGVIQETFDIPQDIQQLKSQTEANIIRCPDATLAEKMITYIDGIRKMGDTVGGVIACKVEGVPVGLGAPAFDKLHADLGKAMLSINAAHGFEYGSGFAGTQMLGSEHNDIFEVKDGKVSTQTNYSGGIQGGISNGMPIEFKVAFKPIATIMHNQDTIDTDLHPAQIQGKGRHDPCVLPRAVPIVEAMAALVIADHYLRNKTIHG